MLGIVPDIEMGSVTFPWVDRSQFLKGLFQQMALGSLVLGYIVLA